MTLIKKMSILFTLGAALFTLACEQGRTGREQGQQAPTGTTEERPAGEPAAPGGETERSPGAPTGGGQ